MDKFSLIQQLQDGEHSTHKEPYIDYRDFEIIVEGKVSVVSIPRRETDRFEKHVNNLSEKITNKSLRNLLREFRGKRK